MTRYSNTRLPCFSIRCQAHREYCIRHPSTWYKTKLFVRRPSFIYPFPILHSISGLSLCNPHNSGCLTPLYQLVQSDYLSIPLILFSCWYTLCIRLITCQSLLLPNTSTHLLESHPFPLSLLSSFVITLLSSTSFLLTHWVKPLFFTPSSESNLWFSPFSSLSKYPFHLPMILSRSLKTTRCSSFIWLFLVKSSAFAIRDIFLSPYGVSISSYNVFIARALAVLVLSLAPCLPACSYGCLPDVSHIFRAPFLSFITVWFREAQICLLLRLRLYSAFVLPVLAYNMGAWGLTKTELSRLDAHRRRHLRQIIGIRWPHRISNDALYRRTHSSPISAAIRAARWSLFGHVLRLPLDAPVQRAIDAYLEDTGTPKFRGRPRCTLPTTLGENLRRIGRQLRNSDDIDALRNLDRSTWRDLGRELAWLGHVHIIN